jgi:hypothetical protein
MTSSSPGSQALNLLNYNEPGYRHKLIPEMSTNNSNRNNQSTGRVGSSRLPPVFATRNDDNNDDVETASTCSVPGYNNKSFDEGTRELPILIEHECLTMHKVDHRSSTQQFDTKAETSPVTMHRGNLLMSNNMGPNDAPTPLSYTSIPSNVPTSIHSSDNGIQQNTSSSMYAFEYNNDADIIRHQIASPGLPPMSAPSMNCSSNDVASPTIDKVMLYNSKMSDEQQHGDSESLSKDAIIILHNDSMSRTGKKGGQTINNSKQQENIFIIGEEFEKEFDALSSNHHDVRSVGSETINGLLVRIETTKNQIEKTQKDDNSRSQYRLRTLIENLVVAAEEMEKYDKM